METILQTIATKLGMAFFYGTYPEFEDACKNIVNPIDIVLFYEAYDDIIFSGSQQTGGINKTYPFQVWIVTLSEVEELASVRVPKIRACEDWAVRVLNELLRSDGFIVSARATPVLSATSNPMAGIRMNGSYTMLPENLC